MYKEVQYCRKTDAEKAHVTLLLFFATIWGLGEQSGVMEEPIITYFFLLRAQ